jgi:hypothetical protein
MLEVYSDNITVAEDGIFPLQNVKVFKGPVASPSANAINLNRRGVYLVKVDAVASVTTAGVAGIQLVKNGIEDPSALTEASVAASGSAAMGFSTYIQVEDDATPAPGSAPDIIRFVSTGVEAVWHINVLAQRIIA